MSVLGRLALLAALGAGALPTAARAQAPAAQPGRIELTAIAGYQVNTDIETTQGDLRVDDTEVYGAVLGIRTAPGLRSELLWLYSEPTVRGTGVRLNGSSPFTVATHYFQIGGTQSVRREAAELFAGATLGAALFMPEDVRLGDGSGVALDDTWVFAFTLGGGVKVHLSPKVALRFEARLAAPVYFTDGAIYVGGGGAGMAVSGGIPIWQWNFLGGLVFSP